MPTKHIEGKDLYFHIDGNETYHIPDFDAEIEPVEEYIESEIERTLSLNSPTSFTFTCKINWDTFYKLNGFYDWVCKSCPNKRVVHLIKHGKNERVKRKNFFRAIRIIAKLYI